MLHLKRFFALLLAAALCLSLMACSSNSGSSSSSSLDLAGADWRTTGVVRASGTITCNGEDTTVLVCVHREDANFYYDSEEQTLYDNVLYPISFGDNVWDIFAGIEFTDLNGDGNSDVTMKFNDVEGEIVMVWFWDAENLLFVFQPDCSQLGMEDGRGDTFAVPVLVSRVTPEPFRNMDVLAAEYYEDDTYYFLDTTQDGQICVVNTVLPRDFEDERPYNEYLTDCALALGYADTSGLLSVEQNAEYTANMSYPVYIVTYTAGANEDSRVWTVFAMGTDLYTYLYGFCATLEVEGDMTPIYHEIFAGLDLTSYEPAVG